MLLLTRSLTSSGRLAAALALVVVLALAVALWASRGPAIAQDVSTLGVDMLPENNSEYFVGAVQTCSEAQVGDQLTVDVFVRDVQSLAAWELRIGFDGDILNFHKEETDYQLFLHRTLPKGRILSISDEETPDRYFLAAAEYDSTTPDSGSGVLARIQFTAVAEGRSSLTITSDPVFLRPRLTDASGDIIGDSDGDSLFITGGEVAVGEPCSAPQPSPPVPTPPPPTPPPDGNSEPEPNVDAGTGGETDAGTTDTSDDEPGTAGAALVSAVPSLISLSDTAPSGSESSGSDEPSATIGGGDPSGASDGGDPSGAPGSEDPSAASDSEHPSGDPGGDDGSAAPDGQGGSAAAAGEDALAASDGEDSIGASNGESDEETTIVALTDNQPGAQDAEGTTESTEAQSVTDGSGSSGPPLWLLGAIFGVALVVGTGGTLALHMLRTR